ADHRPGRRPTPPEPARARHRGTPRRHLPRPDREPSAHRGAPAGTMRRTARRTARRARTGGGPGVTTVADAVAALEAAYPPELAASPNSTLRSRSASSCNAWQTLCRQRKAACAARAILTVRSGQWRCPAVLATVTWTWPPGQAWTPM